MGFNLSENDIIFAAVLAAIITFILNKLVNLIKTLRTNGNMQIQYDNTNVKTALAKCYSMFPKEMFVFRGSAYKRGMNVRVTTMQHYTFEGKIIGSNNHDMVCVITPKYIIAHEISHIADMVRIEDDVSKLPL